jgi:anaerobic magnesium-protoporphyrin IX monomethyl ester cyclase
MRILLLSMPDSFEHTSSITMRMPNGAIGSLAGNVDAHHDVACADLILVQRDVRRTIERLVGDLEPDVVGLSVMTFQRRTAHRVIRLVKRLKPDARIVVGGYDPSLAPQVYEQPGWSVDAIVRGEGDITFRELLRRWERGSDPVDVSGLSYRSAAGWTRNPDRPASSLAGDEIKAPKRAARVLDGYTFIGRRVDVVETSRGCTYDCSFCSIIEMRGRNFHTWPIERVIADILDAKRRGARAIFIVDDNLTLNVRRFENLCDAMVAAGVNDIDYLVQGMTSAIAAGGDALAARMKRAGFRYVFLGIENVLDEDLELLKASAKNARRESGRQVGNAAVAAIESLHRHGMYVIGGLIVGNPSDTRASIDANLAFARRYVDWPYVQHPTPYPGTPMTRDFRARGLILSERPEEYDGTTAVVRNDHLAPEEIEFLRWRAERWLKVRHFWPVVAHDPLFCLRFGAAMLRHTYRGSSLRSMLGLEDERTVFARYRAIRRAEREYLPEMEGEATAAPLACAS